MTTCGCVARWASSSAATANPCPASSPTSTPTALPTITVELAVAWARLPERIKPITVDFRLSAVRGFARYLHAIDPAHEIPPPGLLGVPRRRPTPYIYTPDEIADVLAAARRLQPPLRAAT